MTKEQAQEMLAILSAHFAVKQPKLNWSARTRRGWYNPRTNTITVGPKHSDDWTVVHEFAHHLDRLVNRRPRKRRRWASGTYEVRVGLKLRGIHDVPFRFALLKVAEAWYGDSAKYPWHQEYPAIAKWWKARQAGQEVA
jgi:hypothetical protein